MKKSLLLSPNFPFPPKKLPIFYGWIILVASTVGLIMSIPGQTMGVSVFTDDLIRITGLSRIQVSAAYMLGTIASSLILPYSGKLSDSLGARRMAVYAALGLGFALSLMGGIETVCLYVAELPFRSALVFSFLLLVFLMLRQFGQGILTLVSRNMLTKWFQQKRGLVVGISGLFASFGFSGSPLLLNLLIENTGWVRTCFILAGVLGLGMSLFGWFFFRDNPEECGLKMDGENIEQSETTDNIKAAEVDFTLSEARRTFRFWVFNLGLSSSALIITAVTFHIVSLGELSGLTRGESFALFLPIAIVSTITNLFGGWLSDRTSLKYLLMGMMIGLIAGLLGLIALDSSLGRVAMIGGLGVGSGYAMLLTSITWPQLFGRKHLGAISGLNMGSMVFASAIGPFLFGLVHSWTGSYELASQICMVMPILVLLAAVRA